MLSFEEVEGEIRRLRPSPRLVAIDGLPCAGKSTLANRLSAGFGWPVLALDDFFLPPALWPPAAAPAFPFPFFRRVEFQGAVRSLRAGGRCAYQPYDWDAARISDAMRELRANGPVLVEGCSVLDPAFAHTFDLRLFVECDRDSWVQAWQARDGDFEAANRRDLYVPSVELYLRTEPHRRAHFTVAGRGADRTGGPTSGAGP